MRYRLVMGDTQRTPGHGESRDGIVHRTDARGLDAGATRIGPERTAPQKEYRAAQMGSELWSAPLS